MLSTRSVLIQVLFLIVVLTIPIAFVAPSIGLALPQDPNHSPKTASYFLKWDLTTEEAYSLSRFDLVILDMEVQQFSPQNIKKMRSLNPDIKILAYVTSQEIMEWTPTLSRNYLRRKLWDRIDPAWFMNDEQGEIIRNWPKSLFLNVTNEAPEVNGKRWNTVLPEFMKEKVLGTGLWDGLFYDNAWDSVQFVNGGHLDLDADGMFETNEGLLNRTWFDGMETLLSTARALAGPHAIIIGNGGDGYGAFLNGRLIENFPLLEEGGWNGSLETAHRNLQDSQQPHITIINANSKNTGKQDDYRLVRFGLASALQDNAYYSFDDGDQGHHVTWWYDEFDADLGKPIGRSTNVFEPKVKPWSEGVWRRDFQNGIVVVNATPHERSVPLFGMFETLRGRQEPTINTGATIDRLLLAPYDGRLLLRPLTLPEDAFLTAGTSTAVFNVQGETIRNVFTTSTSLAGKGRGVLRTRFAASSPPWTVVAREASILVKTADGRVVSRWNPYGPNYRGTVQVAIGDLDGNGKREIITGTEVGGAPRIRIFDQVGKVLHPGFFAFSRSLRGGVHVATGDLDGDGALEIIAGAGRGQAPWVRVFDRFGQIQGRGFLAFDPDFHGGVAVAAGRFSSSSSGVIVAAPASGGGPTVLSYDRRGNRLTPGFLAFDATMRSGLHLSATDLNHDGVLELLVQPR